MKKYSVWRKMLFFSTSVIAEEITLRSKKSVIHSSLSSLATRGRQLIAYWTPDIWVDENMKKTLAMAD